MFCLQCRLFKAVLVCMSLGGASLVNGDDPGREAASILEGIAVNADAIRSFDVLLKHQIVSDIRPEHYREETRFTRLRVDWDAEAFLYAVSNRVFSDIDGVSSTVQQRGGLLVRDGKVSELKGGGLAPAGREYRKSLRSVGCPDLRLVGLQKFPQAFSALDQGGFENVLAVIPSLRTLSHIEMSGGYRLQLVAPFADTEETSRQTWEISAVTQMPSKYVSSLERPVGSIKDVEIHFRDELEWAEINGIYVPTLILGTSLEAEPVLENGAVVSAHRFEAEKTTHFHWFTVNEAIAEEQFSWEMLEQVGEFQKLVDPALCNAKSLLDL